MYSTQAIQDLEEFVSLSKQSWRNYNYVTCSPIDPLQWMGAVKMGVQLADKKHHNIHTTPVHQLTSCEVKSCVFPRNRSSIGEQVMYFWHLNLFLFFYFNKYIKVDEVFF